MNTKTTEVLKNALRVLSDNRKVMEKDGFTALADDMACSMREIEDLLTGNCGEPVPPYKERPCIVKGLDDEMYLVFEGSWEAELFLINLGIDSQMIKYIPFYHCGGYENSILIDLKTYQEPYNDSLVRTKSVAAETETYLRALSTWMLENDHDMTLPDGVLDTDPLELAHRLSRLGN